MLQVKYNLKNNKLCERLIISLIIRKYEFTLITYISSLIFKKNRFIHFYLKKYSTQI